MKIAITGHKTTIADAFVDHYAKVRGTSLAHEDFFYGDRDWPLPSNADAYLFCQGYLAGKSAAEISKTDAYKTWMDNFGSIAADCDAILDANPKARICIITSYSGIKGSYDSVYAGAKAAMNLYIETKRLKYPGQQIVGIAPHIVSPSRMTDTRTDQEALTLRRENRRRQEWIAPEDVAKLAHFLLFCDSGNITNTIIPITGGIEE